MILKKCFLGLILASILITPTMQRANSEALIVGFFASLISVTGCTYIARKSMRENKDLKAENSEFKTENINLKAENSELKEKIIQLTLKIDENKEIVSSMVDEK